MGARGRRVRRPEEIRDALAWARATSERERVPVLVEILTEQEENAAMGPSIAKITEFHPTEDGRATV
jgi:tartronate-semialdehyde synthase